MAQRFGVAIHAYCLMLNHLLLHTPRVNLSAAVGWFQTTYSVRFNRRHRRSGHLYQGRFKAHLVEADGYARQLVKEYRRQIDPAFGQVIPSPWFGCGSVWAASG
jgi:REP element-mobilizing transposase RayT